MTKIYLITILKLFKTIACTSRIFWGDEINTLESIQLLSREIVVDYCRVQPVYLLSHSDGWEAAGR